jgi:uncharacterized membrane protein
MAAIVAFSVKDREMGEEALERLEGEVEDVALVYKTEKGKVKVEQTSQLSAGQGVVRGGLLGAAVSIFAGPLIGVAAAGGAVGAAYAAMRDKGVDDKLIKLAGKQLENGQAAVFVLADEPAAAAIESAVLEAGMEDVQVGAFPEEAAGVVREALKLS